MNFAKRFEQSLGNYDPNTTQDNGRNATKITSQGKSATVYTDMVERFPTEVDVMLSNENDNKFVIYETDLDEKDLEEEVIEITSVIKDYIADRYTLRSTGFIKKQATLEFRAGDRIIFASQSKK